MVKRVGGAPEGARLVAKSVVVKVRASRGRRVLAGLVTLCFGVGLVGALGAGVVGWHYYEKYSADLPTLDTLRVYEPRVMSRVYAGG